MPKNITGEKTLYWIFVFLLAYMPFHLFLSRWLSLYTGGLGQWDAGKDILTLIGLGMAIVLARAHGLFKQKAFRNIFLLSALYGLLHLAFYIFDRNDQHTRSFIVAVLFNGRILAYLFIGMVVARTYNEFSIQRIIKILLIVSTITCLFAFAQYLLPKDLMTHFGYSIERGAKPSFFIDDKPDFPRVMSTIRDPNSYGAYLIMPISLLFVMALKRAWGLNKTLPLITIHLFALLLTFSRGAWLGTIISLGLITVYSFRQYIRGFLKRYYLVVVAMVVIFVSIGLIFKDTYVFKNVILHSDEQTVQADPNELRVQLQNKAIKDIRANPEGYGPGTAGLVSIGNPKGVFLSENYYLQIGYEVGIAGLLLFLILLAMVYRMLMKAKADSLGVVILGSFWAYVFISLLIHLWSNEAVAAQWWLLAGLYAGMALSTKKQKLSSAIS